MYNVNTLYHTPCIRWNEQFLRVFLLANFVCACKLCNVLKCFKNYNKKVTPGRLLFAQTWIYSYQSSIMAMMMWQGKTMRNNDNNIECVCYLISMLVNE